MTFGFTFLFLGFIYPVLQKLGLGKVPGDFCLEMTSSIFYFPIFSSIIIASFITLVLSVLIKLIIKKK